MSDVLLRVHRQKSLANLFREKDGDLRTNAGPGPLYDRLRSRLATIEIDGLKLFVAEGDTLLDEDQLWLYALSREGAISSHDRKSVAMGGMGMDRIVPSPNGLLGMVDESGNFIRWPKDFRLSYCVLKATFSGPSRDANYRMVVERMREASAAWQATCDVQFEYKAEYDDASGVRPSEVVFPVRELDTGGKFIAAAFFPNEPLERRRVLVDPSFYKSELRFDKAGVFRHELGHVLGFRHEHIRSGAPPECDQETLDGTVDLTSYDPKSVMHYFCGGVGSASLDITETDRAGAVRLYGPPRTGAMALSPGADGMRVSSDGAAIPVAYVCH